jgi:hypothetical protein
VAKVEYFGGRYVSLLDNWQANREAMALIQTPGSVLTMARLAPHLGHRPIVKLAVKEAVGSRSNRVRLRAAGCAPSRVMGSLGMMTTWFNSYSKLHSSICDIRERGVLFIKKNL